jgi:hypothetical protein
MRLRHLRLPKWSSKLRLNLLLLLNKLSKHLISIKWLSNSNYKKRKPLLKLKELLLKSSRKDLRHKLLKTQHKLWLKQPRLKELKSLQTSKQLKLLKLPKPKLPPSKLSKKLSD